MKFFLSALGVLGTLFLLSTCGGKNESQEKYNLSVSIPGLESSMVYLRDFQWELLDSALPHNGNVTFQGRVSSPHLSYLVISGFERERIPVFLENTKIEVLANLDSLGKAKVKGSDSQLLFENFVLAQSQLSIIKDGLYQSYKMAEDAGDSIAMAAIDQQWEDLENEFNTWEYGFIVQNNASPVAAHILFRDLKYKLELNELEAFIDTLSPLLDSSGYVVLLRERIEKLQKLEPGQPMPDFTQNDTAGNPLDSKSFRGKYLLIDFWASWCGPCRRENPNVVLVYNELKDQGVGFEILGVSFDTEEDKWLGAIEMDGLPWPHVSDLQGWDNAVGKIYGIEGIPHTVLVDPNGIIIAHKLRGEKLKEKLKEVLLAERS